jgi:hypothetical protein
MSKTGIVVRWPNTTDPVMAELNQWRADRT